MDHIWEPRTRGILHHKQHLSGLPLFENNSMHKQPTYNTHHWFSNGAATNSLQSGLPLSPSWKYTVFLTIKRTSTHHRFHSRHALAAGHSGGIFTAASPMARAPMLVKTFSPLTPHSAIYPSHWLTIHG